MGKEIIKRLRDEVSAQDLILQIYRNYTGKDYWNIMCSAMDWIDVVIEAIDIKDVSKKSDSDSSIRVMTFIMCIDVMWETVQQLHRVFFDTNTILFTGNMEVFYHKLFQASDNNYFKTIRTCLTAHPIDLDGHSTGNKQEEHRYVSWSGGGFSNGDFSVMLYSDQPDKDALFLDIYFDGLLKLAEQRYAYLNIISTKIAWQREQYLNSRKSIEIERTGSLDEQILVLIKETKQRFDNDCYNYELDQLEIILSTQITNPTNLRIVNQYGAALLCKVDELFAMLQEMRLITLENTKKINDHCPTEYQYIFSKLAGTVFCDDSIQLINIDDFKVCLGHLIDFGNIESVEELYVCIKTGFFYLNSKGYPWNLIYWNLCILTVSQIFSLQNCISSKTPIRRTSVTT